MFVKITAGVFGHNVNGRVVPVYAGDVVEVDDAIGDRLIANGIAVYTDPDLTDDEDDVVPFADDEDDDAAIFPEYSADMKRKELEAIALEMGADSEELSDAKNKAAVIAILDAMREEFEAEGNAPAIDAAAAIR